MDLRTEGASGGGKELKIFTRYIYMIYLHEEEEVKMSRRGFVERLRHEGIGCAGMSVMRGDWLASAWDQIRRVLIKTCKRERKQWVSRKELV